MRTRRLLVPVLCAFALLALLPGRGEAQTPAYVANPKNVEFFPSTDHSVTLPNGTVMVTRYEIRFYLEGAAAPVQVGDLGKPAPEGDGIVRAGIQSVIASFPMDATRVYVARVVAIGPTGEGVSTPSNPFGVVGPAVAPTGVVLKP